MPFNKYRRAARSAAGNKNYRTGNGKKGQASKSKTGKRVYVFSDKLSLLLLFILFFLLHPRTLVSRTSVCALVRISRKLTLKFEETSKSIVLKNFSLRHAFCVLMMYQKFTSFLSYANFNVEFS